MACGVIKPRECTCRNHLFSVLHRAVSSSLDGTNGQWRRLKMALTERAVSLLVLRKLCSILFFMYYILCIKLKCYYKHFATLAITFADHVYVTNNIWFDSANKTLDRLVHVPAQRGPPAEKRRGVASHTDQVQICRRQASLLGLFHSTASAEADCVIHLVAVWPDTWHHTGEGSGCTLLQRGQARDHPQLSAAGRIQCEGLYHSNQFRQQWVLPFPDL